MIDLSIIVVSYNTCKLTSECIRSVVDNTKKTKYEVLVVDNGSTDGSVKTISALKSRVTNLHIIKNKKNLGFAKANNQGLAIAKGRYILLLNSDTVIHDNVLGEMIGWMDKHESTGIASCALRNTDGSMQGTGGYFPTLISVFSWMTIQDLPFVDRLIKPFHPMRQKSFAKGDAFYTKERDLDWVTGAFFLIRRGVFEDVGYFDEDYFMYTEETDYCYRAKRKGWKVKYLPKWSIAHHGGASGESWSHVIPEYKGIKLFYKKHFPSWQYLVLRLLLKVGALGRIFLFGLLEGKEAVKVYAKAFKIA